MEGHPIEPQIEDQVRAARRMNLDRTKATYDLRTGVDFSKPRRTAEAIARVLWQQDVEAWWDFGQGTPAFKPTHTVEVLVPGEQHRKILKTVEQVEADLRDEELAGHVSGYVNAAANYNVDWTTVFLAGPLWSYMIENSENKQRRTEALNRLFVEMSKYIVITAT